MYRVVLILAFLGLTACTSEPTSSEKQQAPIPDASGHVGRSFCRNNKETFPISEKLDELRCVRTGGQILPSGPNDP